MPTNRQADRHTDCEAYKRGVIVKAADKQWLLIRTGMQGKTTKGLRLYVCLCMFIGKQIIANASFAYRKYS